MNGSGGLDLSPWVRHFAGLVTPGGTVLDVACGAGRHSRFFLDRGHPVTAVDRSVAGIADLLGRAGFEFVEADLEHGAPWPLGDIRFDAVVVTNYLHRPLFPALAGAVAIGGVLIYETFAIGNERFGRPRNRDFLLYPGELWDAFGDRLDIVAYVHGIVGSPPRAVVQRICARNAAGQPTLLPP